MTDAEREKNIRTEIDNCSDICWDDAELLLYLLDKERARIAQLKVDINVVRSRASQFESTITETMKERDKAREVVVELKAEIEQFKIDHSYDIFETQKKLGW